MRTSLGISAGNEVVCSALVTTAANGARKFDYRVVSAEEHSDLGDLVASSIELMTTQLPASHQHEAVFGPHVPAARTSGLDVVAERPPTGVAVAYRGKEQAQAIRMATGKHREPQLVPETTAALTFLRDTGLLDRYGTVAVIDLGASGCTVSVADPADGTVLHTARSTTVSGRAIDDLLYRHLVDQHYARRGTRPNRSVLINRARTAKEHLSVTQAVTIDHIAGRPLKLTRTDFERLAARLLRELARFTSMTFGLADRAPEAVVVIGGGANIPAVLETLRGELDLPVLTVPDPDAVIAKGAALLADTAGSTTPIGALTPDKSGNTLLKAFGTVAGAIVVVGLIVGYGVNTGTPNSDDEVSPAGTTSSAQVPPTTTAAPTTTVAPTTTEAVPQPIEETSGDEPYVPPYEPTYEPPVITEPGTDAAPSTTGEPTTPTTPPTTTGTTTPTSPPTLRPDPNLPPIPFPEGLGPGVLAPAPPAEEQPAPDSPSTSDTPSENSTPSENGTQSTETTFQVTPPPPPRPPLPGTGSAR
ncbi:Hsp70 family protein [Nocardia flavorosea]|uniref:Hsp70 family protein n=1 Tax=Nocardia flavorosea TaxID=53429 RepID=UPI001892D68E|nr:Hsp70 family protein [Nocardia flavorosea]MBF6350567.1 Hsp70 family protein [Nocardia flavorosea]